MILYAHGTLKSLWTPYFSPITLAPLWKINSTRDTLFHLGVKSIRCCSRQSHTSVTQITTQDGSIEQPRTAGVPAARRAEADEGFHASEYSKFLDDNHDNRTEHNTTPHILTQLYSSLVQRCFTDCVNDFTSKALSSREESCLEKCSEKFLKHSERVGQRFQEQNAALMQKR